MSLTIASRTRRWSQTLVVSPWPVWMSERWIQRKRVSIVLLAYHAPRADLDDFRRHKTRMLQRGNRGMQARRAGEASRPARRLRVRSGRKRAPRRAPRGRISLIFPADPSDDEPGNS